MTHTDDQAQSGLRLNKALAAAGVASRRKADELIFDGRVQVNGETVAEPGRRIDPARDAILVDGRPVSLPGSAEQLYLLCHKPVRTVTTMHDPEGRPTVLDLLPPELRARRPVPVGRLDYFSEGLLLLTTDGELVNRLIHPRHHVDKVYEVVVREDVTPEMLTRMRSGMVLAEGERLAPVRAEASFTRDGRTLLRLTLVQGLNRQIRRMCRDLGLTILTLRRISQGPIRLGELAPGAFRELTPAEVAALKRAAGLA